MVENGVADMAFHNAKYKNIYKTYKPFIDKEKIRTFQECKIYGKKWKN